MSQPAFVIAIILMTANIAAAILYYCFQRPTLELLPRMPITVGRVFGLLEGSSLIQERETMEKTTRVGYGQFVGVDSQYHVGIERSSRLQKLGRHGLPLETNQSF